MSRHDDAVRLRHMLDYAAEAIELCGGRSRQDLDRDRMFNLALVRLIEIVGEAANRVSKQAQQDLPEIPWREVISMRNRVVHGYDAVNFDILWAVVRDDLPPLAANLRAHLKRQAS